ncbi:hypothetical protein [Oceanospirillum sp.]|uniref:hypothetical protein n=1 Tax=Oceanospirillum sp. TaxID=2021254 RepID=UPI003A942D8A
MADATDRNLTSSLFSIGAERLALLGKYHKVLMQGYLQGFVDEGQLSESALRKLISARILWRPDETQPLTLRPQLSELIASMVSDENRRQVNADVAQKLEQIHNRVQAYKEAQFKGDYSVADMQLQRLTELVHDLSGQFEDAIDSLWNRLNSDFGFVGSLNEKIRENERAQQQLRRLLDGLQLIDFNQLIELAEGSSQLRKLLVSRLQHQLSGHHGSLLEVQKRLVALLAKFRQQQSRSLLINNMVSFLKQHPAYSPADYPHRSSVPELFNQAAPIKLKGAAAFDRAGERQRLAELVHDLPKTTPSPSSDPQSATFTALFEDEAVAARQKALKQDVENFYLHIIDRATETPELAEQHPAVSALSYRDEYELEWDPEIWLYQIIADYQALPRQDQRLFRLTNQEAKASATNHLMLIQDIQLQLRV